MRHQTGLLWGKEELKIYGAYIVNSKTRDSWNRTSDDYYKQHISARVLDILEKDPSRAFPKKVYSIIHSCFPDLRGKRVCVPSSGDNVAVFGFHLLGAKVTSADISERQIYNAQRIAAGKGWDIEFICEDSVDFAQVKSNAYDLVYTSNGVHVWISDVLRMYRNFHRVLHDAGSYIMFETHPFIRPFNDSEPIITVKKPYEEIGPFGEVPNYAWRVQDILNAAIDADLTIRHLEEFHPETGDLDNWWYKSIEEGEADNHSKFDWRRNPWAVLPQWISFSATK
jgi:SAM-dependent methyltransferase